MGNLASQLALGRGGIWDQVARGQEPQRSAVSRPIQAVSGVVTGDALAATKAAERKAFEAVTAWLAGLGVRVEATTLDTLLQQAAPLLQRVAAPSVATPVATPPVDVATPGRAASSERARLWRLAHPEEYAAAKARSAAKRKAKA